MTDKINGKTISQWRAYVFDNVCGAAVMETVLSFLSAVEERDKRIAWQERLLAWCSARLKRTEYRILLDKYRAAGPTEPDQTKMVQS